MHHYTGWGVHRDGDERVAYFIVERCPWWVAAAQVAADVFCKLTRHRSCQLCCNRVTGLLERHHEKFEIPATPKKVAEYNEWRGWGKPFFMNDDGTQSDYSDDYTRMP